MIGPGGRSVSDGFWRPYLQMNFIERLAGEAQLFGRQADVPIVAGESPLGPQSPGPTFKLNPTVPEG